MNRKKIFIPIAVVLAIAVVYIFLNVFNKTNSDEIGGSGTIEVTEVEISSKLLGRIEKIMCDEGDRVKAGDLLVTLMHPEFDAQLEQAKASLDAVQEQMVQLNLQVVNAKKNFDRAKELFNAGFYSKQQLEKEETQYKVLNSQLVAAKQLYNQSNAQITYINTQIENTYLKTPISGVVLQKNAQPGETITAGMSILTIGDLEKIWIKIYVSGDKLGKIKLKDKAIVKIDTFPNKNYEGKITYISSEAEFTPKNIQTKDERVRLVYAVKISVDNKNEELKAGMPADAVIYVQK
ncbi:MAG: efflux RND transporter periplasmic adaptor subunit [Candidatus Firestonebacteria bacterium]